MVASAVYVLDVKGKVLISRNYRGDVPANAVDKFMPLAIENEDDEAVGPVLQGDDVSYVYVQHNNLYRMPANATLPPAAARALAHAFFPLPAGSCAYAGAGALAQCWRSHGKTPT